MFKKCYFIFISIIYCLLVSLFINISYVEAATIVDSQKTEAVVGFYEESTNEIVVGGSNSSHRLPQTGNSSNMNLVLSGIALVALSFIIKKKKKVGN